MESLIKNYEIYAENIFDPEQVDDVWHYNLSGYLSLPYIYKLLLHIQSRQ